MDDEKDPPTSEQPSAETETVLTLAQVADELGLDVSSVRRWVLEERLPATKVPPRGRGRWLWSVTREDLAEFLAYRPARGAPLSDDPEDGERERRRSVRMTDNIDFEGSGQ